MGTVQSIVLAGGISKRMGFPKALLPFGNSFFLHRVYESLVAAEVAPVHIVINAGLANSLKSRTKEFPQAHFVLNKDPALGQIHSLQLGLQSAREAGAEAAVVALVDQPAIAVTTIAKLCEALQAAPECIHIAAYEGRPGHPLIIPVKFFDLFLTAAEGRTARDIIADQKDAVRTVETDDPQVVADVDSPEDFARLRELENEID